MVNQHITNFLNGKLIDPISNIIVQPKIDTIWIDNNIIINSIEKILSMQIGNKMTIVCDNNTYSVLAERYIYLLGNDFQIKLVNLGDNVDASFEFVQTIIDESKYCDFLVAIGSGSINDLTKYSAYLLKKKYILYATAPSMNGYISKNATIIKDGEFFSYKADAPIALFCDIDIIKNAPIRLISSGIGDSLCRATCQFDIYLSNLIFGKQGNYYLFDIMQQQEKKLVLSFNKLNFRDDEFIRNLCYLLVISSISMYIYENSIPASQSEHMLVKTMHMLGSNDNFYHGEEVAVMTSEIKKIQYSFIIENKNFVLNYNNFNFILGFFPVKFHQNLYNNYKIKKKINIFEINSLIMKEISDINFMFRRIFQSHDQFTDLYSTISVVNKVGDLGWDYYCYLKSIISSKYTRDRFTILDFC